MLYLNHLPGSDLHEKEIHLLRRHPITLLPLVFVTLLLIALPPSAYVIAQFVQPELLQSQNTLTLYVLGASIFFLFGWMFLFQRFIEYWLDVLIITDKRILDIDQSGLFSRTVSELRLYRTQDVTSEIRGFWHTVFDYGDIYVQTAAEVERFHMQDIAHPNRVAKMILELAEQDRKGHLEETVEEFGMPDKETKSAKKTIKE
ncbi:PH domain-containing protein [Patescibacteria group bacterium]|nr:PH domain-containing protein [Patescibacteria group bacterium]